MYVYHAYMFTSMFISIIGNPDEYGTTPLMYAAKKWNLSCCEMLCEAGAPINQRSVLSISSFLLHL